MNKRIIKKMLIDLWDGIKLLFVVLSSMAVVIGIPAGIFWGIAYLMERMFGENGLAGFTFGSILLILIIAIIIGINSWYQNAKKTVKKEDYGKNK